MAHGCCSPIWRGLQEAAPDLGRRRLPRPIARLGGGALRFRLRVVLRPDQQKDFAVLPRHWVVERTFAWLNHHRRLSKDYEGQESSSEVIVYIAMICLMLRRLARD